MKANDKVWRKFEVAKEAVQKRVKKYNRMGAILQIKKFAWYDTNSSR